MAAKRKQPFTRARCLWQALAGMAFLLLPAAVPVLAADPVRILFDTDMDSDCDDAGALAMLHALADRGEAKILGTMVSSKHPWSAACVDAINTYFGRPDLPIGAPRGPGAIEQGSKFARRIAEEFPHDMKTAPDATPLYRSILASQTDSSVVIVTVGDLTNLRYLLESKGDGNSSLTGVELVRRKVRHWVCMGSRYPADLDPKKWGNFKPDAESTVKAIQGWPTLITFTGGGPFAESVATGKRLNDLAPGSPVRRVYELYFQGPAKNRHSADQIALLVAVRGVGAPWKITRGGYNHIFPDGTHEWRAKPDNPLHQYISALDEGSRAADVSRQMEELMLHTPRQHAPGR